MKFVKITNIGDSEEMIINIDNISTLVKNKKFKMGCSDSPPYEFVERDQIEGEFEYLVWLKSPYMGAFAFKVNKENYELIKSKIGA